jgi:hypothetical protein
MAMSKAERLRQVHSRAMRHFDAIQESVRDERMQALKDRRFYSIASAQWEGPLGDQFENKPRFEMNKIHLAVIRIINEYRNNRIDVDFTAKDGSQDDKTAEACDGLYRADEQDSGAQEAFDNAFEEAVGGGFGAIRVRTEYEDEYDEDNTQQRIRIEPVFDADSTVFFDLDAKRQDKADAKRAYLLTGLTPDAYEEEWGMDVAGWPKDIQQTEFDWCTPDIVYIAEYYEIEEKKELVYFFEGISLTDEPPERKRIPASDLEDEEGAALRAELEATGFKEVGQKRIKTCRVHKYIMDGAQVLEDCGYIAGKCIPLIPNYGKRWFVDGIERFMGHVRLAVDAQRLKNMLVSALAEISAQSSVEKPIVTPEQIMGHQVMWSEDNIKRYPYLLLNQTTDGNGMPIPAQPIAYTKAPSIPPALAALLQITEQDLQDLLGNQQAGEQVQPNMSGKAIELVQNRLDMQVFIYMSNFAKCVKRVGEVWLSMAQDIYVEDGRKMKTIANDGSTGSLVLNQPKTDPKTSQVYLANDLSEAKLDVNVEVGPSSTSKRQATVRALTGMLQITQDPETMQVLTAMTMMNMEGEGISDVRQYFRKKLLAMGAVQPTEEEAKDLAEQAQNQQPDPNAQYLQAAAEKQRADALKATAETELTSAKIGNTQADTIVKLAGVEQQRIDTAMAMAAQLNPQEAPVMPPANMQ